MKTIHDHKLNGLNEHIEITADEPGSGGASHHYAIKYRCGLTFRSQEGAIVVEDGPSAEVTTHLKFQNGPISTPDDFNGLTNEALLAVLIDRMRGFQSGQFACRENAIALTHLEEALMWLQKRTRDRMARGVEGTLQK